MTIKNISNKIISLGPEKALLPEQTAEVAEDTMVALSPYIAIGLLEVSAKVENPVTVTEEPKEVKEVSAEAPEVKAPAKRKSNKK